MTKIRCQVCGGEELHTEGPTMVVCDCCGAKTFMIPECSVVRVDNPISGNLVTIEYDRNLTEQPRKGLCLNDKMFPDAEPCKVCKVVQHKLDILNRELISANERRELYLAQHPELQELEEAQQEQQECPKKTKRCSKKTQQKEDQETWE